MNGQTEAPRAEIFVPPSYEGALKMNNPRGTPQVENSPITNSNSENHTNINSMNNNNNSIPEGFLVSLGGDDKNGKRWSLFSGLKSTSPGRGAGGSNEVSPLVFKVVNKKHWREFKVGEWSVEGSPNVFGFDDSGSGSGSDYMSDRGQEKGCDVSSMKNDCNLM